MRSRSKVGLLMALLALSLLISSAVWAQPTQISNTLYANLNQLPATLTVNADLSPGSSTGLWDVFSITVDGVNQGDTVKIQLDVTKDGSAVTSSDLELEYRDGSQYKPLSFSNGSATTGDLTVPADKTFNFRVTWLVGGTYVLKFTLLDSADQPLSGAAQANVVVSSDPTKALKLSWVGVSGDTIDLTYVHVNDPVDVKAEAALGNLVGISHVDGVRYVVKVTKADGSPATDQDVEIQGLVDTVWYPLAYDGKDEVFYWGPPSGFTFGCVAGMTDCQPSPTTSDFLVKAKQGGNYAAEIYAIQVGK